MEFEIIGKDEVVERPFVAVKLFFVACFFAAVEVFVTDVFGFDIPHRNVFLGQNIVGRTTLLTLGFIGGADIGHHAF